MKADIENKLSKYRERSIEDVAGCRAMLELIYDQGKNLVPLTEAIRNYDSQIAVSFKRSDWKKAQK